MKLRIFSAVFLPLCALAQAPAVSPVLGVDKAAMNTSVDPCVDFHQFACGNWMSSNPLPSDRARWGRFGELQDRNEKTILRMLEGLAADKPGRNAIDQKIGDLYASCLDIETRNKKGIEPVKPVLARISGIASMEDLVAEIARLHRSGVGVVFGFGSSADAKDSSRTIAAVRQGGLSLPDREYYLSTGARYTEARQRYLQHIGKMFQLAGDAADTAAAKAQMVLDLEILIAKASRDRVSLRDPNRNYNVMSRAQLQALTPGFAWGLYFQGVQAPAFETLNVGQPDFFQQLAAAAPNELAPWKAYLAYHVLRESAALLSEAFEAEGFDFFQRHLAGVKEPRPRASRCATVVDDALGDLLGQRYIETAFGADSKVRITELVDAIEKAMGQDIEALPWMSPDTKKAALEKLKSITNNVGYPKKWRDYGKVSIARNDYFGNAQRAAENMYEQRLAKIGKPTDRSEWSMTTPTVNAFYSPQNNSINFPAGILQFPFFDAKRDPAVNLGGIGAVIGHEITHGFDDQGRKFDSNGNLRDWWTSQDGSEFEKRAACIADQYSSFSAVDDLKLNGRLTLGENTADSGGVRVAYRAVQEMYKGKQDKVDGFTPEQRLFLGFAQVWCENMSPQEARRRATTDPHAPGRYRVNGTFQNLPEFQKAFSCKAGQPMVRPNACSVW